MKLRKGVQKIYAEVAGTYEVINHILTFGLDIFWRKKMAQTASRLGGTLWLDVCSGTGEMAYSLSQCAAEGVQIFAVDFSSSMLLRAKHKFQRSDLRYIIAEAGSLPFPDGRFDLVTISFATRNLNHRKDVLEFYLKEFFRVLKPGGFFLNLETSQPSLKLIRLIFHFYVRLIVRPVGRLISGSRSGYRYLAFTIPRFYNPEEFSSILKSTGFSPVSYKKFLLGVSAIHTAAKSQMNQ
jgi:demethylmenaquinone methyltransferase/2-methoxy-6-polyprenyl-1,4-benzoquinol methylase